MRLLEEQIQNEDVSQIVPSFNMSSMQNQVESMIQTAQEYNQMCDSDVGFQRQDSYEQRWEEVNSLINQQAPQQGNHTYTQLQEYNMDNSTSNPLMQNASLIPATGYDNAANFGRCITLLHYIEMNHLQIIYFKRHSHSIWDKK